MTVDCVDDNPVAVDDQATVNEDSGSNAIDVLGNDTDVDGGPKSVASVTQPDNGTVAITGDGSGVSYTPDPDYCNDPARHPDRRLHLHARPRRRHGDGRGDGGLRR